MANVQEAAEMARRLVSDAGGQIVGRTRIQKAAYILEAMGLGEGFSFSYRHYGPYSEDLSSALNYAQIFDMIAEDEKRAAWGGTYSVFRTIEDAQPTSVARGKVLALANASDPIELELAATAVYLANAGSEDPWRDTEKRKPEKADNIEGAKKLLTKFKAIDDNGRLPAI